MSSPPPIGGTPRRSLFADWAVPAVSLPDRRHAGQIRRNPAASDRFAHRHPRPLPGLAALGSRMDIGNAALARAGLTVAA